MCQVLTFNLAAQTDLGAFRGRVLDQGGAAIAGATVTLRNPATSWERTAQTDGSGDYSFVGVPLTGQYSVTVNASQFKPAQQDGIQLRAGSIATVNFTLNVSGGKSRDQCVRNAWIAADRVDPGFHAAGPAED